MSGGVLSLTWFLLPCTGRVLGAIRLIAAELFGKNGAEISAPLRKNYTGHEINSVSQGIGYRQILEKLGDDSHDRQDVERS
jgi:hypothetical protein